MKYVEVDITKTSKGYSPKSAWQTFDNESKTFKNMVEAKNWLHDEYGNSRKQRMYHDIDGDSKHIGYVIGFRNSDYQEKWLEQHWINFAEVERTLIQLSQ